MLDGYTTFGDWVRQRRRLLDLTQPRLAALSFYSEIAIRNIEKDAMRPAEEGALQLAHALGIPERYLSAFVHVARGKRPLTDLPLPQHIDQPPAAERREPAKVGQHRAYAYLVVPDSVHILEGVRAPTLFGRRELLDKAHALLDSGQHVVLQGAGGRGKTAVAAELAAERAQVAQTPALWVQVGDDDADYIYLVMGEIFDAHRAVAQQSRTELRARLVCDLIHRAGVRLIVLDNVWDGAVLASLLSALPPSVTVLVTSQLRYPLDHGVILEMEDLQPHAALELLGSAAHQDLAHNPAALRLVQQLGFLPLALSMAGKTLYTDQISVEDYFAEIQEFPHQAEMPLLVHAGHESMTAVIEISLRHLDDRERQAFAAFGALFEPGATADLLALYLKRPRKAVTRELTALYRRGLVEHVTKVSPLVSLYQLHSLTFSYARQQFRGGGRAERIRLIAACREYVTLHKADVEELHAERTNVLNAAAQAHALGRGLLLIEILRVLAIDSPYLAVRGHDTLLLDQLDAAISSLENDDLDLDPVETLRLKHFLLGKRGNIFYDHGELAAALAAYQRSLAIAQSLQLQDRQCILNGVMCKVYVDQQALDRAFACLSVAREIATTLNSDALLMRTLEYEGYYYAQGQHDFERARAAFSGIKTLAEQLGDPVALFHALLNLGSTYHDTLDYVTAISLFTQAMTVVEQAGFQCWKADCLFALAMSHDELGHDALAVTLFRDAEAQFQECGMLESVRKTQDEATKRGYAPSSPR